MSTLQIPKFEIFISNGSFCNFYSINKQINKISEFRNSEFLMKLKFSSCVTREF